MTTDTTSMTLAEELQWRGFVNQTTFTTLDDVNQPRTFYWGVDPSAKSMHIGQLAMAMMIRHFIAHGHTAILLVGGATGMIGDPGGKTSERDLKTIEEITTNKDAIADQYKQLFTGLSFRVVDNYDWFKDINYLDFLRDIGKHFSMTQLLDRDFVKSRIGEGSSGISYAEFSYGLIQGYDYLHLYRTHGASLQLAGSDQWGNSLSGVSMIKKLESSDTHVWTAPLIVDKTTGRKFGKSEGNAIWLDPTMTSPYQFYQFWLNVDDAGVIDYLKIYTLLTRDQIEAVIEDQTSAPAEREAQRLLAYEVTKLVHGEALADRVRSVSDLLFGRGDFDRLTSEDIDVLSTEIPTVQLVPTSGLQDDNAKTEMISTILVKAGLCKSRGEARDAVTSGGVTIVGGQAKNLRVDSDVAIAVAPTLIKKGKNGFTLVR
ncbi:MAG TPA: tyrosine--tRNA ligase [Candidatus Saccharimonadales bacterium]